MLLFFFLSPEMVLIKLFQKVKINNFIFIEEIQKISLKKKNQVFKPLVINNLVFRLSNGHRDVKSKVEISSIYELYKDYFFKNKVTLIGMASHFQSFNWAEP